MAIKPEIIEQIKETADIQTVVSDYVTLKRVGSSYRGLSPFQDERTPSFYIKPSEGFFKDFSSGKGGDAITFIMEVEGLDYIGALKHLANKYNIEIEDDEHYDAEAAMAVKNERESLLAVLEYASNYYSKQLTQHPEGQSVAMGYFNERGFRQSAIETFKLGYATPEWEGIYKAATKIGFKNEFLSKAGLIIEKEETGKVFDRFRNRVMFPIHDVNGQVIAFGGRIIGNTDKKQAKYINSPETPVYHKSNVVYGLYQAKKAIRNQDQVFLTEGYTDVISLHQAGIENVVSTSGTALTTQQIKLIARFTKNFTVLFDGDVAGIKASLRGIDLLLEQGINVRAIVMPTGQDPDSYVQQLGASGFKTFVAKNARDFLAFKTEILLKDTNNDPYQRAKLIQEVVQSIVKIPDPVTRSVFYKETAEKLNVEEQLLVAEGNKLLMKQQRSQSQQPGLGAEHYPTEAPEPPTPLAKKPSGLAYLRTQQEKETIRLLVLYGHIVFEEGGNFGDYLLDEIADVEFGSEQLERIITLYKKERAQKKPTTIWKLMDIADEPTKEILLDMAFQKYELSPQWALMHDIHTPTEEELLDQISAKCILRLKKRYLHSQMAHNLNQLAHAEARGDVAEVQNRQREHMHLKGLERKLAAGLGTVVSNLKIKRPEV